jgi:hypothetical protein
MDKIVQIPKSELIENPDRGLILGKHKSHDSGQLQVSKAVAKYGLRGFLGIAVAPRIQAQAIP